MKGDKGEKRKQRLLKIAYRLFISKGYEETSIDEIITEAQIAKGTFYYHFKSKDALLESIIDMMINEEVQQARQFLSALMSVPQKIVAIITSLRPQKDEAIFENALNKKENIILHEKVKNRIIAEAVPVLCEVISEGISQGIFECDNVKERVRIILVISSDVFDDGNFTTADIDVFIDTVEKVLGAKKNTFGFVRQLIN